MRPLPTDQLAKEKLKNGYEQKVYLLAAIDSYCCKQFDCWFAHLLLIHQGCKQGIPLFPENGIETTSFKR